MAQTQLNIPSPKPIPIEIIIKHEPVEIIVQHPPIEILMKHLPITKVIGFSLATSALSLAGIAIVLFLLVHG